MTDILDHQPEDRISFGQRDNQSVPVSWAEAMLTELADTNPRVFGEVLQRAALGDRAPAKRGRPAQEG